MRNNEALNIGIGKLMELIQEDGYFYTGSARLGYEIRFAQRADDQGEAGWGWRIWRIGQYLRFHPDNVDDFFRSPFHKIDMDDFRNELLQSVACAAAYHDLRLRNITGAMGNSFTQKAIRDLDEFGQQLAKTVTDIIRKSRLKLIKTDQKMAKEAQDK